MNERRRVVIVGAGIVGLFVAHHLAKRGVRDVIVLDKAPSLLLGASGRNGGGIRAQWTTIENIQLAKASIRQFRRLAQETGTNTWFRQGGYLFLARTEAQWDSLRKAAAFQNAHDVRTRLLSVGQAREIVPLLSTEGVVGASFNPDDGTLFPWPVVHGVAEKVRAAGIPVELGTEVIGFEASGRVRAVLTTRGRIECEWVVLCAGSWSPQVARLAGIDLPVHSERHEILVTESLKPFLDPMLVDMSNGLYVSQAMRGEAVGGMGYPHTKGESWESSFEFAQYFARALTRLIPSLKGIRALRQWAGTYDMTRDARPILGPVKYENFLVACGFSGHGFMISPVSGQLMAELIVEGRTSMPLDKFSIDRFGRGELETESLVIG